MKRAASCFLAAWALAAAAALQPPPGTELGVEQILERNAAARGGLEAWRKVQTMVWAGHVESADATASKMPFVLELQRPNKAHFEILGPNQRSMRVFDGALGWKLRPTRSGGAPEVQPYDGEELRFARDEQVIDGLLMDHEAKGLAITLEGLDVVEGHRAFRLAVRSAGGAAAQVWVDAQTFLELRQQRDARAAGGGLAPVSVYYRDYRPVDGLLIPSVIESAAAPHGAASRLVIERVSLNAALDARVFAKPGVPIRRKAVTVDIQALPAATAPGRGP